MNPYEAPRSEAQPGVVLEEPVDYQLSEPQLANLPADARLGVVIVGAAMQQPFASVEAINDLLAAETGFDDEELTKARHSLTGSRGNEGMRLEKGEDGFRLLLTARGLDMLDYEVAKVKSRPA